ncbi:MAG: Phage protein [Bartonella clarridgeiae]|nr:MAG: Phage protein [Bartonella clarridgeiae]
MNKTTKLFKKALLTAAEKAGDQYGCDGLVSYLCYHAINNPVPFFSLLAKVLPLQVTEEGKENTRVISRIEIVPMIPNEAMNDKFYEASRGSEM